MAVPLSRYALFFSLAIGIGAIDLATKAWMFSRYRLGEPADWIWNGVAGFQINLNEGALVGIGWGLWPLFSGLSILAALGIVLWLFRFGAAKDWLLTIALGFVTAGILGNLYDRLGLPGLTWPPGLGHVAGTPVHAVRDFILVMIGNWPWPTFNIADSSLVCGAALLVFHAFVMKPAKKSGQ
jgi:signal peptidase II